MCKNVHLCSQTTGLWACAGEPVYTCACENKVNMVLHMLMCELMHGYAYTLIRTKPVQWVQGCVKNGYRRKCMCFGLS